MTEAFAAASFRAHSAICAKTPRILLIATMPWVFPARLAKALRGVGFHVEAVCQVGHPLRYLTIPLPAHRLGWFREAASVAKAIERSSPDLLLPCDDPAVAILHDLHRRFEGISELIERSLGNPASFNVAIKRTALIALARSIGLQVPRSESFQGREAMAAAGRRIGYPCVLKRDQTWSGIGVAAVRTPADLDWAWSWTSGSVSFLRGVKAMSRDRRPRTLLDMIVGEQPKVELQEFISGAPANRAVLCRNGRVIAGMSVVALQTAYSGGPASLVRVIDHPQMAAMAEAVVSHLGLSGFCGFDFMLTPSDEAYMLELNPRATPICHLGIADGTHLAAALFEELTGRHPVCGPEPIRNDVIALFPTEWQRDPSGASLRAAHHDAPFDEPALMARVRGHQQVPCATFTSAISSALR
jgi:glutathione synthase/RimK-type ligase-like ATP-grasp enzyme